MAYQEDHTTSPYTEIDAEEARRLIENGVQVIDVRRPDEWRRGHIASAQLVTIEGIYAFGKALEELNLPQDQEVIFVCASGQRSASASEIARLVGLNKVYNLAHGMHEWQANGLPIER